MDKYLDNEKEVLPLRISKENKLIRKMYAVNMHINLYILQY